MLSFNIPEKLNGEQLLEELKNVGIESDIPAIRDGKLWLSIKSTQKAKAEEIVSNHIGVDRIPTIQDKLASAGIDLDELRVALGL